MPRGPVKLVWRGAQVVRQVQENLEAAYTEFGLTVERFSKKELEKGHGVISGTLRRSIHLAEPGYDWSSDNVAVKVKKSNNRIVVVSSGPERGSKKVRAKTIGARTTLLIGSGMSYALAVHQGHHGFDGYHYLTNGLQKTKPELPAILNKHRMKK